MTTSETRCTPKHPTLRSDRMPETKGGPDNARTLPGPNAHGSPRRSDVNAMSKDTEGPAGGVDEGLRERLRALADEPREDMRMDAYYFSFEPTGVTAIDRILSEVATAGKAYHHTENWYDGMTADDRYENSHQQRIQRAAGAAADALRALLDQPTEEPRPGDAAMAAEDAELAGRVLALLDRAEDAECTMVPISVLDAVIHGDWPQPDWPEPTDDPLGLRHPTYRTGGAPVIPTDRPAGDA